MPANRVKRSVEDERLFQKSKRMRNTLAQRERRQKLALQLEYNRFNIQVEDIQENYIGKMDILCKNYSARHFQVEEVNNKKTFNDCCSHGEVNLEPLPDSPDLIKNLFNGSHEFSKNFHERIRSYNNAFAFASFNANLINFPSNNRPGPYCFKIHGQIYYQINTSLYPSGDDIPSFGQLFIVDQNEATNVRSQFNKDSCLNMEIIEAIGNTLCEINVFAKSYQMMHEELQQTINDGQEETEMRLIFSTKPGKDARRYNVQKINEVAAIFTTTANGDIPESYVTIHNKNTKKLEYVSNMDPNVEPWIYPLFYPFGTRGWHRDIPCVTKSKRVSRAAYIKYRMASRNDNIFLMGGRLFQQWVVDNYVKIEKDRMNFCRLNQKKIRADTYQGLIDHLKTVANESKVNVGKMGILPSTFTGSPRNMLQHYQDAMAIVRKFGKPDLFITMTCNPNWREIQENLLFNQTASDRPDIVSQIPDHIKNPRLHSIVMKNMIHGPCGDWCKNEKGKCSKNFPKKFQNDTLIDENGYPSYRRRNTGAFQRQTGNSTDNQYVVPHNPMLLLIFNCHINVEIVSSIKAIKYLYKYIYKGHDAASIVVTNSTAEDNTSSINYDEIVNHIETRYVSPVEACDRIYGRPLQEKSHSITRLPVHLSNQQTITLNDEAEETMRMIMNQQTMLMDYFALNQRDPMARIYTYAEIPEHYVFKKGSGKNGIWKPRKQQFNVIGRMYSISPSQVELFHLGLLLLKVKGATSFENIRTIDGVMHDTYRSACLALGLIEDDEEWDRAMTEGEVWMMPKQLRHLFVRILIHCCPVKPEILWENYKDSMSDDLKKKYSLSQSYTKLYHEIVKLLEKEKSNISKFATMPSLTEFESLENLNNEEIVLQNHSEIGLNQYKTLNIKQKIIVDEIMDKALSCRKDNLNSCFYIDGPGGSGKTYVYSTIYHLLRSNGKKVATMAFTGIAAILLPEGRTMHNLFAMPVPIYVDSTSNIKQQSKAAEELRNIDVIICDEAPMAPRYCLELADRTCRDIMNNKLPFGGKIMLMGGDFRQLLPVLKNENMRTLPEESEFAKYILDVGNGTLNDNNDNLVIPKECLANRNDDIVEVIFKKIIDERKYESLSKVAVLSARHLDVDNINDRVVQLLDEDTEKIFTAIDSTENCDNGELNNYILPEYLNTLNPPNFPPYELKMRLYCIVMLLRNISQSEGLCNGTRLQVLSMSNNLLKCRILTGDKENDIVFIHRITLYCEDVYPFTFKRRQFPIKIAFGMTINKCQGQTFEMIN
ncbi:uncharacterized protein LOC122850538 [Aphidius gifuensis]|uniref:uncharacterized protein LOC122850538 n=1 Tax=Aphidius gifuensis TaxID=684658 RepID=UPI001CDD5505|nr:uncharacterized protein LOC122850538 [Aphidius gifuensis]